jgi:hypothetical protein
MIDLGFWVETAIRDHCLINKSLYKRPPFSKLLFNSYFGNFAEIFRQFFLPFNSCGSIAQLPLKLNLQFRKRVKAGCQNCHCSGSGC